MSIDTREEDNKEVTISRDLLQIGLSEYVDKIFNKELDRVYILSSDEIEEESVMIHPDEYYRLKKKLGLMKNTGV